MKKYDGQEAAGRVAVNRLTFGVAFKKLGYSSHDTTLYIGAEPGEEVRPCGGQPAHLWGGPGRVFRPVGRQRGGQDYHLQDADGRYGRHGRGGIRQ